MKQYSFDADLRSVLKRLGAARPRGTSAATSQPVQPAMPGKVIAFRPQALQPRLELAHVALRRNRSETHDAVT